MPTTKPKQSITRTELHGDERIAFLETLYGKDRYIQATHGIYAFMCSLCSNYRGCFWKTYKLGNGGSYMAPDSERQFEFFVPGNYFEGKLSADAAGIVVTLFALSNLSFQSGTQHFATAYHKLLDWICEAEHPEIQLILNAID